MPRGDGTGPMGRGTMTGWGSGYCGSGLGEYAARGRGFRHLAGFCPSLHGAEMTPPIDRQELLQKQVDYLEKRIKLMKAELNMDDEGNG